MTLLFKFLYRVYRTMSGLRYWGYRRFTRAGLTVKAALETNQYPTKTKVTDGELEKLRVKRHDFHGEWNYTLSPRK